MKGKAMLLGVLLFGAGHARGQVAVVDAANVAQTVKAVEALERQITELEATYRAMSGSRGLGTVFYDPALQGYLPGDWMRVYQAGSTKGYPGIPGSPSGGRACRGSPGKRGRADERRRGAGEDDG